MSEHIKKTTIDKTYYRGFNHEQTKAYEGLVTLEEAAQGVLLKALNARSREVKRERMD